MQAGPKPRAEKSPRGRALHRRAIIRAHMRMTCLHARGGLLFCACNIYLCNICNIDNADNGKYSRKLSESNCKCNTVSCLIMISCSC